MKHIIIACVLLGLPAFTHAEVIDEAEAKRRGIPVEKVQVEKLQQANDDLRQKISQLEAEISRLKEQNRIQLEISADKLRQADAKCESASASRRKAENELATIRSALTPAQTKQVEIATEIAKAVLEKRPVVGMTLVQFTQALGRGEPKFVGVDEGGVRKYEWYIVDEITAYTQTGLAYKTIRDGGVIYISVKDGTVIDKWEK